MKGIRKVRPTDLLALLSTERMAYQNEAYPWERIGARDRGPRPLESAVEQWLSFATGRHTWVRVSRQTLQGMAAVRKRGRGAVWEVDCLFAPDGEVAQALLERVGESAAQFGVEKVFLRLAVESDALEAARKAGLMPYAHERLWHCQRVTARSESAGYSLRQRTPADDFGIFRLYCEVAPVEMRQIEAVTLREWIGARDARMGMRSRQMVLEREGRIMAWVLSSNADGGMCLTMLVHPEVENGVGEILEAAVGVRKGRRDISCLLPEYATAVISVLAGSGFKPGMEYVALGRRLQRPVGELEEAKPAMTRGYSVPTVFTEP